MQSLYIAAVLETQTQLIYAIRQLVESGIAKTDISVVGRVLPIGIFDVISEDSSFSIPPLDKFSVTGYLRTKLLQLISQSQGSGISSGFVFLFISLGIPVEKAALYQTCLQNDEFFILVEAKPNTCDEIQMCLYAAEAKNIFRFENKLNR